MAEEGEQGVRIALGICGASNEQADEIIDEGFNGMRDLLILEDKDVTDMMSNLTKLPANRGGVRVGAVVTKVAKAFEVLKNNNVECSMRNSKVRRANQN
jgi:hypothetical protein